MCVCVCVADASHSPNSLAPVSAMLLLLSTTERGSMHRPAVLPSPDTKQIKSWPFHY